MEVVLSASFFCFRWFLSVERIKIHLENGIESENEIERAKLDDPRLR